MEQKRLSVWLKWILGGIGLCGAAVYCYILPVCGRDIADQYPEFANRYWPWLIFLWMTAIPCFLVLLKGWKIAGEIGEDRSFSIGNAERLKQISLLAAGDSAFFFIGNVVMLLCNSSHPGILLLSLVVVFAGIAVSVAAAVLSHLVYKAASLQEENELTI